MTTEAGHVYVLEFSDGTVKVGKTKNTAQRLSAHKSDARKFGLSLADSWVSPPHAGFEENEGRLKDIARDLGGITANAEYFRGIAFADVVKRAEELSFAPPAMKTTVAMDLARPDPADDAIREVLIPEVSGWSEQCLWSALIFLDLGYTLERAESEFGPGLMLEFMREFQNREAKARMRRGLDTLAQMTSRQKAA